MIIVWYKTVQLGKVAVKFSVEKCYTVQSSIVRFTVRDDYFSVIRKF